MTEAKWVPARTVSGDEAEEQMKRFLANLRLARVIKKENEKIKKLLVPFGADTQFTLGGKPVLRYSQDGQFLMSLFLEEQGDIAEQFMITKTERVLDREALQAAHPSLYSRYRASKFLLIEDN